jgi:hypothetical protein
MPSSTSHLAQAQLAFEPPIINRGLFANHFLKERLPEMAEWSQAAGLDAAFDLCLALYKKRTPAAWGKLTEPQVEEEFVQPILKHLWGDDCYLVQPTIAGKEEKRRPDYALFRAPADKHAAEPLLNDLNFWRDVPCLADAKRWGDSLDKQRASDENPSAQIGNYLYMTRVRWAILTNGRLWRLYEHERSRAGGIWFEVDLAEILNHKNRDWFKYFWQFFRRQSFLPGPSGRSFVEQVFQGSVEYATRVGDRLKDSVYDALRLLMDGCLSHPANKLDKNDPGIHSTFAAVAIAGVQWPALKASKNEMVAALSWNAASILSPLS